MSKDHCISVYHPFVFSDACLQAVNDATCEDHKSSPPSYIDTCFPPCMGVDSTCQGDQITTCSHGRTNVYLCSEFCKISGKEYVGVCGLEYNDGGSPSGQDMCFCE